MVASNTGLQQISSDIIRIGLTSKAMEVLLNTTSEVLGIQASNDRVNTPVQEVAVAQDQSVEVSLPVVNEEKPTPAIAALEEQAPQTPTTPVLEENRTEEIIAANKIEDIVKKEVITDDGIDFTQGEEEIVAHTNSDKDHQNVQTGSINTFSYDNAFLNETPSEGRSV